MTMTRAASLLFVLLAAASVRAQTPAIVVHAERFVAKQPTVERRIGLAELRRAHGAKDAGLDELHKLAQSLPTDDARAAELHEFLCWRRLPVTPGERDVFRQNLARLKALQPGNSWVPVWDLYLLGGEGDRKAFLDAARKLPVKLPERFPSALGETAHRKLLEDLGLTRVQAGVEVIAARNFDALHALRDLDRAITREADFQRNARHDAEANALLQTGDRCRLAYLKASRHLVECLFALHLRHASKDRDALLTRAQTLPFLHDRARLAGLLERMDDEQAWNLIIEPLLTSELAVIDNPPDIARLQAREIAQLHITSDRKSSRGDTVHYDGNVRFRLNSLVGQCSQLTVVHHDQPASIVMTGAGMVNLRGFATYPGGVTADRFAYHAETGSFSLGGDVRLVSYDKNIKLRACTLTQRGELRDARSLIDDLRAKFTLDAKLELLPALTKFYTDDELPDDVRYLLALQLLRKHLTWHAPYLPPLPDRHALQELRKALAKEDFHYLQSPWQDAFGGETWMHADIGPEVETAFRESLRAWYKAFNDDPRNKQAPLRDFALPGKDLSFWRLRTLNHPDVVRARKLLERIDANEIAGKAARWRDEIDRNNTVITFDIAGAAPLGRAHSMLMDVRNTERVRFKLYRVQRPEELLHATKKIGVDFIYRDHRLNDDLDRLKQEDIAMKAAREISAKSKHLDEKRKEFEPAWKPEQLVGQWEVKVVELKSHRNHYHERRHWRHWHREDWYDEIDAHYFDDECLENQPRIRKDYRPYNDNALSSWQCDRIVTIPEKVLSEAGAYVLIAEANGQTAHVPIVVEPISLTLRRCRDGVFVQASDAEMTKPLAGAKVYALDLLGHATTNKEGVAFARTLAMGDRAIVVHHQGRYAIGGFGHVFEGLYEHDDDEEHELWDRMKRLQRAKRGDTKDISGRVYADRHVVVAYTDRPTYRPGQDVNFKLIVRKLLDDQPGDAVSTFRGDEFDRALKMELPNLDQDLAFAVVDPKGREVQTGTLKLSEFGTAAGKVSLNTESVLGAYSLRVRIAGQARIVPEVFAVKHYRRPNFEVTVAGVPDKLARPQMLALDISSHYYFGPPVAKGSVDVRLLRAHGGRALVNEQEKLDDKGKARIDLRVPKALDSGRYVVVCSVTDESGRTVTMSTPFVLETPDAPAGATGLAALPRFVAIDKELTIATTAKEVLAEQQITSLRFPAKNGAATLKFPVPGWYVVKAGDDEAEIFVYGGKEHPRTYARDRADDKQPERRKDADDEDAHHDNRPRWVNLSDFRMEEDYRLSRWERPSQHLHVLFDKQHVTLGDKLRLLVYLPHKNAKLLFTMEGRTILDYAIVSVGQAFQPDGQAGKPDLRNGSGAYHVVELPIKDRHFPNFYLQGRILSFEREPRPAEQAKRAEKQQEALQALEGDNEDQDPRWCRVDVARPKGQTDSPALNVKIETDQAKYKPGDTVRATIKVTDRDGRPQAAELSLAAVDESVYVFGEDNLDSLPAFFRLPREARRFQPKVWRVSTGERWSKKAADAKKGDLQEAVQKLNKAMDAMKQAMAINKLEMAATKDRDVNFTVTPLSRLGGELPAGQIPLAKLREHFHETATWLPQLRTDDAGIARAAFTLPDSLTRYRLTSVALTKTTDIGVGRARITAALPLAVQVFVPRFAVENDRLDAVGIIHNGADTARECQFTWKIEGATVDALMTGRVKVAAKSSTKVRLPLKMEQIGTARVAFQASDGKDSDAEVRTLPVHALGRQQDLGSNQQLPIVDPKQPAAKEVFGKFNKQGKIDLPKGFLASEIHLSLAVSELAQALDGLDYLVDYPYGCIEQTMSRFLPVVMIKHATQNAAVGLRPDMAAKVPDILDKGLTRVYGHQHEDGSWGWFGKDGQNLPMSVYVVYGLARCKATGTKVDANVLRRGCEYLQKELATNRHNADLTARAWYALALAGHVDAKGLEKLAREEAKQVHSDRPLVWCNLALACRAAGLNEAGERLWAKVQGRLRGSWWGHDTESFSLILNTQLAYGAPYGECRVMADRILKNRHGTHWYHTRDTSWAIEALAGMLGYLPEKSLVRKVEVTVGGKKVLEGKEAIRGKELIYRVHLKGAQIPKEEGLQIRMDVDADEPIQVAFRAAGVQRLVDLKATGTHVRLERFVETLDGEPVKGSLKIGQVVRVRLKLELTGDKEHLMIEERRPSLCEFAGDHLTGPAARRAVHQEFRDDRLCIFFRDLSAGTHELVYYLRAETAGTCSMLPGSAYPMYDEKQRGETGGGKLEVRGY